MLPRTIGRRDVATVFVAFRGAFHSVGGLSLLDDNAPLWGLPMMYATIPWEFSVYEYCPMKQNKGASMLTG